MAIRRLRRTVCKDGPRLSTRLLRAGLIAACMAMLVLAPLAFTFAQREQGGSAPPAGANFDAGRPEGWEFTENVELVRDREGRALTFTGPGHAFWHVEPRQEFRLAFRYRPGPGVGEVVFRGTGEPPQHREYLLHLDEGHVRLIRNIAGRHSEMGGAGVPFEPGAWQHVALRSAGSSIEVSVGDATVLSVNDPDPLPGGAFAFGCIAGEQIAFDDIALYALDGRGATPTQVVVPIDTPIVATTSSPDLVVAMLDTFIPSQPLAPPRLVRRAKLTLNPFAHLTWTRTGGPPGGLGYDIRMHPKNPSVMYVTDAWAGAFRSDNGGVNWSVSNGSPGAEISVRRGLTSDAVPVFCLTVDPNKPNTIWAGTQSLRGIFKSTDGGKTWAKMDNGVKWKTGISFRGFTVDPGNSDIVYAAAELESWGWAKKPPRRGKTFDMTEGVLFKTVDGGKNWKQVWRGKNLARYIWINPSNPKVVYLSTGIFDREAANCNAKTDFGGGEGVLKSTDGGKTWNKVNQGLNNLYIGSLYMHPTNPDILLAGAGNNSYRPGGGVYLSTNGGKKWDHTLTNETITSVEFATNNPNIAYAGSEHAVYRSQNGGRNWVRVTGAGSGWGSPGFRAGFPIDFQVHPTNPDLLFANNYGGGNFKSMDGGATWADASTGYTGGQIRGLAVDPAHPARVFASGRSGVFVTPDGGRHWQGLSHPLALVHDGDGVALDPTNPGHVLAASSALGILYQSWDGGMNWQVVATLPANKLSWRSIVFAPSRPSTVYAGSAGYTFVGTFDDKVAGKGIYVSQNGGTHWTPANSGIAQDAHVATLAVHPSFPGLVWAATTNRGLLRSNDGGASWKSMKLPSKKTNNALSVAIDPTPPHALYVGLAGGGVLRGNPAGTKWQPMPKGLPPEARISEIVVDPTNPAIVYAADLLSGVYRWDQNSMAWIPINSRLATREVNALALTTNGKTLYAATEGAGVFRLDLGGI